MTYKAAVVDIKDPEVYYCDGPVHEPNTHDLMLGVPYTVIGGYGGEHDFFFEGPAANQFHFCSLECLEGWTHGERIGSLRAAE